MIRGPSFLLLLLPPSQASPKFVINWPIAFELPERCKFFNFFKFNLYFLPFFFFSPFSLPPNLSLLFSLLHLFYRIFLPPSAFPSLFIKRVSVTQNLLCHKANDHICYDHKDLRNDHNLTFRLKIILFNHFFFHFQCNFPLLFYPTKIIQNMI